ELNLPSKTKVVLIAVGPADELNKVKNLVESGTKQPADNSESSICWVIYGPEIKDMFKEFKKNIIQKADTILDFEEKANFFKIHKSFTKKILESLEKDDWIHLGTVLKIMAQEAMQAPVPVFGLQPSEKLCKGLKVNEDAIIESIAEFNLWRAKKLQQIAMQKKYAGKYTDRHRLLESAIRLTWEQFDSNESWHHAVITEKEACDFIAQCYLFRSRLALAKGSTIPEKKLEALARAWHWAAEKGYDDMNDLKMKIVLEKDKWEKNLSEEWIKDQINSFLKKENCSLDFSKPLHWAVNDRAQNLELISDKSNDRRITDDCKISHITKSFTDEEKALVFLYQARAALRMQSDDISERLKKAVDALELSQRGMPSKANSMRYHVPLSHYLWGDIVDLIEKAAEQEELWEDSAVDIWRRCMEEESRVKVGIQIRWYWSKYRQLYQLAFQAALNPAYHYPENFKLAAEITDSQKSRPTIKALALEKSLSKKNAEGYKKHVEADALFAAGNFVAGFEALKKIPVPEKEKPRHIMDVPADWAAVHFNIIDRNDAHALIVEDEKCRHVSIEISDLWDAFNKWVASDRDSGLEKVCEQSGEMLLPILKEINSKKILFIPHGFLHLVPLHAAELAKAKDKARYLFQEKSCLFLPSWSLAPLQDEAFATNGDVLLTKWNYVAIKNIVERNDWSNSKREENTPDDFFAALKELPNPPDLLVLYCHGQSDFVNPYNSRFVLNGDLTHQRLAQDLSVSDLKKSKVILTACESDLVSGIFGLIDEHLSLANVFLSKGASEVLGALFECSSNIALDLILEAKNNSKTPLYEILQNKQKEWAEKEESIDEIAVFRVMGFPQAGVKEILKTQEDLL
ncbi:MAG: CHAT domain-containing protein, partial [Desulfosarcina sp.]|nr:CHAT domain-containing protein [Desulfobacterales bacterium]